jgi:uncharacterized protein YneF (UPF0154 family)
MTIKFILENWYIILAALAVGIAIGIAVYHFAKLPRADQLKKVRKWLLVAVIEAEKALGSGTGQLKLRKVYDLFLTRFSWLAKIITFEMFSDMVTDALAEMQELLKNNPAVALYLAGENAVILEGVAVEDLDDDQLREIMQQMGFAYTESMTREEMLAALDETATE